MVTVDTDKAQDFLSRLKADRGFRQDFEREPFAALRGAGIELPESVLSSEVKLLGEGDDLSVYFVAAGSNLDWPYRFYFLENQTDRKLILESWRHVLGIGSLEYRVYVAPGMTGVFGLATYEEILWNKCNLSGNSHLVRDQETNKVIAETYNCTCGSTVNYWVATGKGNDITATESHPVTTKVGLKVFNGKFVGVDRDNNNKVIADRDQQGPWETFVMVKRDADVATFMTSNARFLSAENGGGGAVLADRSVAQLWERFRWASLGGNKISLQAHKGQYVKAENGGGGSLLATSATAGDFETFTLT